jgi:post-segregation antitoxin (ccd killing protein)
MAAAKMTVSIPDEMYERAKAHSDLNVSGVLQKALEAELQTRELVAGGNEAKVLAARLAAADDRNLRVRYPKAYQAGRGYAARSLTRDDLELLAKWYHEIEDADLQYTDVAGLLDVMASKIDRFRDEASRAWELQRMLEDDFELSMPRRTELVAFVAGIVDVWEAASQEL